MNEALAAIDMDGAALAFVAGGVLVLALALRAARNAAITIRARLFALTTGGALLGWGLKGPLQLGALLGDALGPWLDDPHAAVILGLLAAVVLVTLLVLFAIYVWIRAFLRLAAFALVGLTLLSLAGVVWLATAGGLGPELPPVAGLSPLLLLEVGGIALVVLGALRALRPR